MLTVKPYHPRVILFSAILLAIVPFVLLIFGYATLMLWVLSLITAVCLVALIAMIAWQNRRLAHALELALQRREFVMHYLPVLDLRSNLCVSAEALIRWQHPQHGLLAPDTFIPHAEHTGLIEPLTEEIIRLVIEDMADFLREHRHFVIAINLSATHFDSHKILETSDRLCQHYHINSEQLIYEITERTLIKLNEETPSEVMHSIRSRKSGLALDDFGVGYSTLAYAQKLPLNYVKLDKQFIKNITHNSNVEKLAATLIKSAQTLNTTIIAEGVESIEQANYLRDHGVNLVQGWYFSRALPKQEFLLFMSDKIQSDSTDTHPT